MTKTDAGRLLKELLLYYKENADTYKPVMEQYISKLVKCPTQQIKTIKEQIVNQFNYFPRLSELGFLDHSYQIKTTVENKEFCFACLNSGVIRYTKKAPGIGGIMADYDFDSRCPCCEKGKRYRSFPSYLERHTQEELDDLIRHNRAWLRGTDEQKVTESKARVNAFIRGMAR